MESVHVLRIYHHVRFKTRDAQSEIQDLKNRTILSHARGRTRLIVAFYEGFRCIPTKEWDLNACHIAIAQSSAQIASKIKQNTLLLAARISISCLFRTALWNRYIWPQGQLRIPIFNNVCARGHEFNSIWATHVLQPIGANLHSLVEWLSFLNPLFWVHSNS